MSKLPLPKLSPGMILYLVIMGVGILLVVLLLILPNRGALTEMDLEIEKLRAELDQQEILKPFFYRNLPEHKARFEAAASKIEERLDTWRGELKDPMEQWQARAGDFTMPPPRAVPGEQIRRISYDLPAAVEGSGFALRGIQVGENAHAFDWGDRDPTGKPVRYRPVGISFAGKIGNLPRFFAWLGAIPYIRTIQSFGVRHAEEKMLFEMNAWIAVEDGLPRGSGRD